VSNEEIQTISDTVGSLRIGQARILYALLVGSVLAATAWANTLNRVATLEAKVNDAKQFGDRLTRIETNAVNVEKKLDHVIEILDRDRKP
jgi:hypothetical protein